MTTSVIVPVYNDPDGLRTTVESLLAQSADDYEIVVVDNRSTDETRAVARSYARYDRVKVTAESDVQGTYAARNAGIDVAEGEVLAFIDADMWAPREYVKSVTRRILDAGTEYLGCAVEVVGSDGCLARYAAAVEFPVERYVERLGFVPTCCLTIHRDVIETVGRFDGRLFSSGDVEFGKRATRRGYEIEYDPEITLYHPARSTFSALAAKQVRIGRGFTERARYHPEAFEEESLYCPRHFLPPLPTSFLRRTGSESRSCLECVVWYFLNWVLRFCLWKGRVVGRQGRAVS